MTDNSDNKRGHAIALFSGGLDSTLAILLILQQNIKVTALTFMTHFGCDLGDRSSCGSDPYPAAEKFGFDVKLMHLGQKFVDIVTDPVYGYGGHMNVRVDCRILMLREAKNLMEMTGADMIITGEVLGQRPFSQVRDKVNLVERESGLRGKLLRPLSAKLLKPTEPELNGLVDRELLEGISGRSRKRQMELATQFDLDDYPSPGGGCLLTDEGYSIRLKDMMAHTDELSFDDLNLLRLGRHFRIDEDTKLIIGRNESENNQIEKLRRPEHFLLEAVDIGSPLTLLIGNATNDIIEKAAKLTARYSSARNESEVRVIAKRDSDNTVIELHVLPTQSEELGITKLH